MTSACSCGQHERDVGGQEVVHLVAERGFAQQLGAPHQVADGHVEVGVARRPVGNSSKWVCHQDILKKKIISKLIEIIFEKLSEVKLAALVS